jgi:hypothetical protein
MEISQENSLCSYLYLKQAKMTFFSSSTNSENRRAEQFSAWGWGGGAPVCVWGRWQEKE